MAVDQIGTLIAPTGMTNLKLLVWNKLRTELMTSLANPPAFTAIASVTPSTFDDGAVALTEITYNSGTGTGRYAINVPAGLPDGDYILEILDSAAPAVTDPLYTDPFEYTEGATGGGGGGTVDANLVSIDGDALSAATLNLKKLNIVNSAGDAVVLQSSGGNGKGLNISGNGTGSGIYIQGGSGSGANGIRVIGLGTGAAVFIDAEGSLASAVEIYSDTGKGINVVSALANMVCDITGISALTSLAAKFSGMTSLPNWLRLLARDYLGGLDSDMDDALDEINGGPVPFGTYNPTSDSLETSTDRDASEYSKIYLMEKLLNGDVYIDDSTSPWKYVVIENGTGDLDTGTRLLEQEMYTVDGTAVDSLDDTPAQYIGS